MLFRVNAFPLTANRILRNRAILQSTRTDAPFKTKNRAQVLFAFYLTPAITYAGHHRAHLATDSLARRYSPATRARLQRVSSALVLIPGSCYLLHFSAPGVAQSIAMFESFPDTFNPCDWLIKLAFAVPAALVLSHAILDALTNSAWMGSARS